MASTTLPPRPHTRSTDGVARIGPNSLIQSVAALREAYGDATTADLLRRGGQAHLLDHLPSDMVAEAEFCALVRALDGLLGTQAAHAILTRAGELTAAYLLAHRIPRPFQWLLRRLPPGWALSLLCFAIGKAAWTFAGSGAFAFHRRLPPHDLPELWVDSAIQPVNAVRGFYGGTFRTLIRTLVQPQAAVRALPAPPDRPQRCRYQVTW